MFSSFLLESNITILIGKRLSVAYFIMLLNGVTPMPPERNTTHLELLSSGSTKLPTGAVILIGTPISKFASFFLNGVSLILVLIRMNSSSVGDEAIVNDL